jgi:aconitate hydratase
MAMLQFISAGLPRTALPTSIHSDHLIVAEKGAVRDLERAGEEYSEVSWVLLKRCGSGD